jgi:cytochrome P450
MTGSSQVGEYDPFSAAFQADPFPVYRWMRDEVPVFHSRKWGWWALSRFDDVRAAAIDPETFLSYEGIDIGLPPGHRQSPARPDPPDRAAAAVAQPDRRT